MSERRSTKNTFDYRHRHSSPGVLSREGSVSLGSALGALEEGWELGMTPGNGVGAGDGPWKGVGAGDGPSLTGQAPVGKQPL